MKQRIKKQERGFLGGPVVNNPLSNAGDAGSIPGWETKILQAIWHGQKIQYNNLKKTKRTSQRKTQVQIPSQVNSA